MNTLSSEVGPSGEHTMYTRPRPNPQPNPTGEHTMSMYTLGGGTEYHSTIRLKQTIFAHCMLQIFMSRSFADCRDVETYRDCK